MTLNEYLALPHRWQWGFCDCQFFPCDWVQEAAGRDPGADWRGSYHDAASAQAMLDLHGGVERLVGLALERLDFKRVQQPIDGDIGIVRAMTGFDAAGAVVKDIPAIRFGPLWAVMSARGPQVKHLDFTGAAWRIA